MKAWRSGECEEATAVVRPLKGKHRATVLPSTSAPGYRHRGPQDRTNRSSSASAQGSSTRDSHKVGGTQRSMDR